MLPIVCKFDGAVVLDFLDDWDIECKRIRMVIAQNVIPLRKMNKGR